ncbi:MAG: hypothetical protein HRU20_31600, partial [Pseudomonadales bacterium]|nr:hypothetical protein [Pseudomonadales bacterium]
MLTSIISSLPLWVLFLLVVTAIYFALVAGFKLANHLRDEDDSSSLPPISSVVASLLALLAFLLALTFNSAANRYETRKLLLLEEVNVIGTAYLRADFLSTEDANTARALLKEYVELRMNVAEEPQELGHIIKRSEQIHTLLWQLIKATSRTDLPPALTGRFA